MSGKRESIDYGDRTEMGMELRAMVLHVSLLVEQAAQSAVLQLLHVPSGESKVLSQLNFDQRVNLLTELRAMKPDDRNKFMLFKKIRNKLVHHLDAISMVRVFEVLNEDPRSSLFQLYPQDDRMDLEARMRQALDSLIMDIARLSKDIQDHSISHSQMHNQVLKRAMAFHVIQEEVPLVLGSAHKWLKTRIEEGGTFTNDELLALPFWALDEIKARVRHGYHAKHIELFNAPPPDDDDVMAG